MKLGGLLGRAENPGGPRIGLVLAVRPASLTGWLTRHSGDVLTFVVGALLLALYQTVLYRSGPQTALISVVVGMGFLASLVILEVGIAIIVLSMLLSPETQLLGGITLRIEDVAIPIVALAWISRKTFGLDRRDLLHDSILFAMAGFIGLQILATLMGWGGYFIQPRAAGLIIAKQVEYFAIFYFSFQYVDRLQRIRGLLGIAAVTAIATAGYNLFRIPGNEIWTRRRISAPFEGSPEPSSIGGYFVLVLAIVTAFALHAPTPRQRRWLLVLFGLVFIPFLFTLSRTSYVSFLLMLLMLGILGRSRKLLVILLLAILVSPLVLPHSVVERVLYTFQDKSGALGVDRSFGERLYIWYKVYWNMRDDPWLGKGVTYHSVIDSYYARVLIETGIVGLAAFALIIVRLFRIAGAVRTRHPEWWARALGLGYTAALIALLVHGFSAITFLIVRIMEPFWLLSGILAGLAAQLRPTASPPTEPVATSAPLERAIPHG